MNLRTCTVLAAALHMLAGVPFNASAQIAVRGEVVYTMSGPAIQDGIVLIDAGRIVSVGPSDEINVPADFRQVEGAVITPGLIDAHTTVGFSGIYNQPHDQDQLEKSEPLQPELRAIDGYNAREPLIEWIRGFGVTTIHTGHGPGALISGQTMIVKTVGETVGAAVIDSVATFAMTLGQTVSQNFETPGTRAKSIAMIRGELVRGATYLEKMSASEESDRPDRDLRLEAIAALLRGDVPALITANRITEIRGALRLAEEFGINVILDGASESYLALDEIKSAGVPVILHPTMTRSYGDLQNSSFETASILRQHGIPFAMQSGFEGYVPKTRVVLFEAAITAANGLSFEDALASITIDAARILGIDGRVGSLEPGKDADVVVFDGDPFEYTSHACAVIVDGVLVSEECK